MELENNPCATSGFCRQWSRRQNWYAVLKRRNRIPHAVFTGRPWGCPSGVAPQLDDAGGALRPRSSQEDHHGDAHTTAFEDTADGFASYLLSDDTRPPNHPKTTAGNAAPRTALVGQDEDAFDVLLTKKDVELRQQHDESDGEDADRGRGSSSSSSSLPMPAFGQVVDDMERALKELQPANVDPEDPQYGVVVAGDFGVIDDAQWATMHGTLRCPDVRDVFNVLRCSTKLIDDCRRQVDSSASGAPPRVSIYLQQHVAHNSSHCFRAFAAGGRLLAVSQRSVDQVHQHLVALDADAHARAFAAIEAVVVDQLIRGIAAAADGACSPDSFALVVDVVYEGGTLPVLVTSCTVLPSLAEIDHTQTRAAVLARREFAVAGAAQERGDCGGAAGRTDDDNDNRAVLYDPLGFRLFRDLDGLRRFAFGGDGERRFGTTGAAAAAADVVVVRRELAVARSGEDLFGDGKAMGAHLGLPVELQHPELFQMDEATRAMLARIHEQQQQQQQ